MNVAYWRDLAILTLKDPGSAARQLLGLGVPSNILWSMLFLVTICNSILFTVSDLLSPVQGPLTGLLGTPFAMFGVVAGGLILTVYSIHLCGRLVGGSATFGGVLVLIVWLQVLRLVVQAAAIFLMLTLPLLSVLLVVVSSFVWLYLLVNFINQAHQLGSLVRSAVVLIISIIIPAIGIAVLLAVIGVPIAGVV